VQSWDTAASELPGADYSVCTTWGFREGHWDLIHVLRERLAYPDLRRAVLRQHRLYQPDAVLIEDAGTGKSLWQDFRSTRELRPMMWSATQDKETRLIGVTGLLESGLCRLPRETLWVDAYVAELRGFPFARHDDQVDSTTQFLEYLLWRGEDLLEERNAEGRKIHVRRPTGPRHRT
jgi:predicted phage terminase large subunit-like protein